MFAKCSRTSWARALIFAPVWEYFLGLLESEARFIKWRLLWPKKNQISEHEKKLFFICKLYSKEHCHFKHFSRINWKLVVCLKLKKRSFTTKVSFWAKYEEAHKSERPKMMMNDVQWSSRKAKSSSIFHQFPAALHPREYLKLTSSENKTNFPNPANKWQEHEIRHRPRLSRQFRA